MITRIEDALLWLIPILLGLIGWLLAYMLNGLNRSISKIDAKLDATLSEVIRTNGGMLKLQTWSDGHEKLDDERAEHIDKQHEVLQKRMEVHHDDIQRRVDMISEAVGPLSRKK